MQISSTKNWSFNSFEDVSEKLFENLPDVFEELKITPVGYSSWSDSISVIVTFKLNESVYCNISKNFIHSDYDEFGNEMVRFIKHYYSSFLNTNVQVSEFLRLS